MKRLSYIMPMRMPHALLMLLGIAALLGCSDDQEPVGRRHVTFEVQSVAQTFSEQLPTAAAPSSAWPSTTLTGDNTTRAWTPPTGYKTYDQLTGQFASQADLFYKSINVFFTKDNEEPFEGTFFYNNSSSQWRFASDTDIKSSIYYLYGYIPQEVAEAATISPNSTYSDGAVLTIKGLSTITHSDVSIIVGAKNGTNADNDGGLTRGQFAVDAKATSNDGATGNHVFLLFDHLYCALRFRFKVDSEYAALRTIKLTKLELMAYESIETKKIKAKYDAVVTLKKNDTGGSPIVSVNFTPDESSADNNYAPIYSGDEVALSTTPTDFMGCFLPGQSTSYTLRCTYNVYDRKGNLVREACRTENAINLRTIFSIAETQLQRGNMYSLTLTVQPTYLYVLSEPDLDSPTIKIG